MTAEAPSNKTVLPGGIFFLRGWLGVIVFLPLGILVACSEPKALVGSYGGFAFSALGGAVLLGGIVYRTWAQLYVGGRKTTSLVCTGPYSLSRHPLYFGTFLVGIGAGIMLQSLTWLVLYLALFPMIYLPVIAEEERALRANHPDAHKDFVGRIPNRILPRLRDFNAGEKYGEVHMKAQWNQGKRGLLTLAAIPALEFVQILRSSGVLPTWLNLY